MQIVFRCLKAFSVLESLRSVYSLISRSPKFNDSGFDSSCLPFMMIVEKMKGLLSFRYKKTPLEVDSYQLCFIDF